jgi:hypothetical protein
MDDEPAVLLSLRRQSLLLRDAAMRVLYRCFAPRYLCSYFWTPSPPDILYTARPIVQC